MKQLLGTITAILLAVIAHAQTVRGKITNAQQEPVNGASVTFSQNAKKWTTISEADGSFALTLKDGAYSIRVESVGKKSFTKNISSIKGETFSIQLQDAAYFLEPLEVKSLRASDKAPFTKTDISKADIAKTNLGQDLPFLLNQTPSVIVTSDAGNGIGYTSMRIRGSDNTRINVTMNGIPYNDAESQGSFFVDLPDIASSANSIQIQRGIGTSTNGPGAFGASINISTNEFNEKAYAESNNSFGSFNTWKNTIKAGSGLINDHFTIDARLSRLQSNGYIDRASSDLHSLYLSTAYINKNTSIRFNVITGKEKTYQAWYGVPEELLGINRTFNPAGTEKPGSPYNNQTDNYQQDHYQLFLNQNLNNNWALNIASFLTRGKGYYEEYKAGQAFSKYGLPNFAASPGDTIRSTDLVRQRWLDNYYYGQVFSLTHKGKHDELTFGGSWTKYDGKHYGTLIWGTVGIPKDYQYYGNYPAVKTDYNVYAKWQHQLSQYWYTFADVQFRHVQHKMNGFEDFPTLNIDRKFDFVNPKAGISYARGSWQAYFSFARAGKEPNRDDFQANPQQQPKAEKLNDFELGVSQKTANYNWSATAYYMLYKDQLVQTGAMNDVGAYTRVNTPNSYRLGLELQGGVTITNWLNVQANVALSRNKIKSFTSYLDDYDASGNWIKQVSKEYSNTDISFSPAIVAGGSVNIIPVTNLQLSLITKYVGKQYLDNTQSETRRVPDYYVQDARLSWTVKHFLFTEWNFIGQVNNVFNRMYEAGGSSYPGIYGGVLYNGNSYSPMAGTNFMIGVNVKL